jgi:ribonuclease P protein component
VVYRCGQRHFSQVLTAFYLLRLEQPAIRTETLENPAQRPESKQKARVGITVGRAMGKAVVRNRIKRRVRAAVAQNVARLTRPLDIVINPKKSASEIEFQKLCTEVARAFDVAEQKAKISGDANDNSAQSRRSDKPHAFGREKALGK